MQKKIKMRSNPEILRLLWDIAVFRFVSYLLIMICLILQMNTKLHIYEFSDKFDSIFFYNFFKTLTSDRCLIYIAQQLRFSGNIL